MNPVPDLTFSLIKIMGALALVVGILLLLGNWFRNGKFGRTMISTMNFRMLGSIPLGMKKSIALVKVADRILVVGIAGETIQLLSAIDDAEQIARIENQNQAQGTGFGKQLKRIMRQKNSLAVTEEPCPGDEFKV